MRTVYYAYADLAGLVFPWAAFDARLLDFAWDGIGVGAFCWQA